MDKVNHYCQTLICSSCLFLSAYLPFNSFATLAPTIEQIIAMPEEKIDLGLAKLVIDNLLYPDINVQKSLKEIESLVASIKQLPEFGDSELERMGSILRYFYTPGPWNNYKAYQYDFSKPMGDGRLQTLDHYLKNKAGNCASMPMLVVILGQRLGIDIYLSTAPRHLFARYHDKKDGIINIETTSGKLLPDQRYIRAFDIQQTAIKSGLYLHDLTKKEAIAVMLYELGRKYMHSRNFSEAHRIADMMLKLRPTSVNAMLLKGNISHLQLRKKLADFKTKQIRITKKEKAILDPLYQQNLYWFDKAESLGWREPSPDYKEKYLKSIKEFKQES